LVGWANLLPEDRRAAADAAVRLRLKASGERSFRLADGFKLSMHLRPTTLIAVLALALAAAPTAPADGSQSTGPTGGAAPAGPAARALVKSLATGMRQAGVYSGADVVDLTTGATLYSHDASTARLPASVQKLYTTTTALSLYGPSAKLTTSVLGVGSTDDGTFTGTMYLRGAGDPTFGSATFDSTAYGTGATVQQLAANLKQAGITAVNGRLVADSSIFDNDRGTPATGNKPSIYVEGELSGLDYDRGWANSDGTIYYEHPAIEAGQQLVSAMRATGIRIAAKTPVTGGITPSSARPLASVASPTIAQLIALTNTPSDNFFAETLLKDIGAKFGTGGTTAAGAAVVRSQVTSAFGVDPRFDDGSGLSRYDRTTPAQVVKLLSVEADNVQFTNSLAVAGESGTLIDEMRGTYAQGRCRGKTGTLSDVSNLVGYCTARDGDTLAFALLMNGVIPDAAHLIQDRMTVAIARYDG
jgi:serine-type D-Ala-D-Ala carboxypeptidase/endopeptidase (penicillin-binding protein 4)